MRNGVESRLIGKLLARGREVFPEAIARDLEPVRMAIARALQNGDGGVLMNADV